MSAMSERILRRADGGDAEAAAEVLLRSRRAAAIPPSVHRDPEVRAWVAEFMIPSCEVWVATRGGEVAGVMALQDDWVEQLYVAPEHQGQGYGAALLALAKAERNALSLWTFESNLRARGFYEANGFIQAGAPSSDNEEGAPAICYRWRRASSG